MGYLDLASDLVKQLEGCRLVGYLDTADKPTNGYGHTGPEVKAGVSITQEIADHDLDVDLAQADARLVSACGQFAMEHLQDHQRAALISFVFNVGADPAWTIWKDLRAGNLADVPTQLRRFVHEHKNGQLVEVLGLEHRREAEIIYWNTGDAAVAVAVTQTANAVPAPPSGYTRAAVTPPAPAAPPALFKTSLMTKAVGAVAALGASAQQVHAIVAPHADESHIFQTIAVGATGVIVAAAIIGLLIHGEQHAAAQR